MGFLHQAVSEHDRKQGPDQTYNSSPDGQVSKDVFLKSYIALPLEDLLKGEFWLTLFGHSSRKQDQDGQVDQLVHP